MTYTWNVPEDDFNAIRQWFAEWTVNVADVDFVPARDLFEDNVASFGTHMDVVEGLQNLENDQWRSVWPTIEDFSFLLPTLKVAVSPDRRMAIGIITFSSTGIGADGHRFPRPGRATVAFSRARRNAKWKAIHTHVSLNPGTPAPSHGKRPAKS
jgi:ketosteroid isomerase-like protein